MARNKVQFQKGLSEAQFAVLYGTEDQCREAVMRWRWPSGFVCPVYAGEHHSFVKTRALYQCSACRRQTSVIAGTIFAATKASAAALSISWRCGWARILPPRFHSMELSPALPTQDHRADKYAVRRTPPAVNR